MRKPISEASGCDVATQPCVQITGLRREVKVTSGLQSGLCIFVPMSRAVGGRWAGGDAGESPQPNWCEKNHHDVKRPS